MSQVSVPDEDLSNWLNVIKSYQRSTIEVFLKDASPDEAAQKWLSSARPPNLAHFGGETNAKPFWDAFKAEFNKFICDEKSYEEEKAELVKNSNITKELLISVIASAIGATIGYAATLLAPAVMLLLYTVGKMGVNAYCHTLQKK